MKTTMMQRMAATLLLLTGLAGVSNAASLEDFVGCWVTGEAGPV
ncbi:hypothetical protein [Hoeflea sp.]